jgi:uncharacterized protein YndB with AHSA1/START domain
MSITGRYEQVEGLPVVRFERTFAHPVAAVWEAITDPGQLQSWFPTAVEFAELRVGAPMVFRFEQEGYPEMEGEIRELEPGRRLVFSWGEDELTFELSEREGGAACRLAFTVAMGTTDKAARDSAGWEERLDILARTVVGEVSAPSTGRERWNAYYEEYKAQGLPATAAIPD